MIFIIHLLILPFLGVQLSFFLLFRSHFDFFPSGRIREVAKENKIEIVENKPLARMLYHNVELGEQIPPELYQMVAEILAYVYGLQGKVS